MKARNKVSMKRDNGTSVYDVYTKKPDKSRHAGEIRAVSKDTTPKKGRNQETVWETLRNESGWTTVYKSDKSSNNRCHGHETAEKTEASRQPFARLGDDLI